MDCVGGDNRLLWLHTLKGAILSGSNVREYTQGASPMSRPDLEGESLGWELTPVFTVLLVTVGGVNVYCR